MNKDDINSFIDKTVEEKRERLYLSDEEIAKVNWELISITVRPQDKRCGIVDLVLAYADDIRDVYTVRLSGNIHLNKVYPNFIKRQIVARIKEVLEDKPATKKATKRTIIKPTHITIKRNK